MKANEQRSPKGHNSRQHAKHATVYILTYFRLQRRNLWQVGILFGVSALQCTEWSLHNFVFLKASFFFFSVRASSGPLFGVSWPSRTSRNSLTYTVLRNETNNFAQFCIVSIAGSTGQLTVRNSVNHTRSGERGWGWGWGVENTDYTTRFRKYTTIYIYINTDHTTRFRSLYTIIDTRIQQETLLFHYAYVSSKILLGQINDSSTMTKQPQHW